MSNTSDPYVWSKFVYPPLQNLTIHNDSCTVMADWVVEILSTEQDEGGDMATILNFLDALVPSAWHPQTDNLSYHENLMTWYYGVWLNDSYYERNQQLFDDTLEDIINLATHCQDDGHPRICETLQVKGDPDVFGVGMVATYFVAAGLATLYFVILLIGGLHPPRGGSSMAQRLRMDKFMRAFEESLDGFLDAALIFASAMLGATVTRFHHLWYSSDAEDLMVYPAMGSVVASVLSVFICLMLQTVSSTFVTIVTIERAVTAQATSVTQTTAEHTQWRLLRMFLWTFVLIFCLILEFKCVPRLDDLLNSELPTSKLLTFSEVDLNQVDLWRSYCDNWGQADSLRKLIRAGLGIQAVNVIWYIKTLLMMAFTLYSHQRPSSKSVKHMTKYFESSRLWTTVTLTLRRLMGTLCLAMMWVLIYFLMEYRTSFQNTASDSDEDSEWGFGQVLAMAQWAPTVFTLIHAFWAYVFRTDRNVGTDGKEKYTPSLSTNSRRVGIIPCW